MYQSKLSFFLPYKAGPRIFYALVTDDFVEGPGVILPIIYLHLPLPEFNVEI